MDYFTKSASQKAYKVDKNNGDEDAAAISDAEQLETISGPTPSETRKASLFTPEFSYSLLHDYVSKCQKTKEQYKLLLLDSQKRIDEIKEVLKELSDNVAYARSLDAVRLAEVQEVNVFRAMYPNDQENIEGTLRALKIGLAALKSDANMQEFVKELLAQHDHSLL